MKDRFAKAEALFHEALELSPEERETFLQENCGADAGLFQEVVALLRASGVADHWLKDTDCAVAGSSVGKSLPESNSEGPGAVIDRYKLLEKIGEGGFGVVYMAEQEQPVRRKVALKIIKLGMDTRSVIARFESERQALALMDHPNIAKVLDAGATDTGRPYFVMELVRGVPITRFCEERQLNTAERLALFIQVCGAIQHAHQKGIIHRDIKPTNVLVTLNDGVPYPLVIDFGVAKALHERLTEKTLFTNFAQMIGTPAYMSPEQAEMSKLDVDTRSDVYSLGVLLYELLTGTTPFPEERLRTAGYAEIQRIITEEEAERPSTRLTALQGRKGERRKGSGGAGDVATLNSQLKPLSTDLDWIVMRCLEKDRTRRYETVNGLATDLKRFLSHEPVVARPPSNLYRLRKLVRRNKLAFGAVVAVAAALLAGAGVSSWQALRATRAERQQSLLRAQAEQARTQAEANEEKARIEAAKSRHVAQFMKTMLEGVGPSAARGRDTTMLREILNQTVARLGEELKQEPAVEAELLLTVGHVYNALGEFNKAEQMFRESLAIRRTLHGTNHLEVAESLESLAFVQAQGAPLLREALAIRRRLLGDANPSVARTLYRLALACANYPQVDEVEALYREALDTRRKLFGEEHPDIALLLHGFGIVPEYQGKLEEAESLFRKSRDMGRKLMGENEDVAQSLASLCGVVAAQSRLPEAESLYRELLTMRRRLNGSDHPAVANTLDVLGTVLARQGGWPEAESLRREALAIRRKFLGDDHPDVAQSLDELGAMIRRSDPVEAERRSDPVEAERLHREAVAIRRKVLATDRPSTRTDVLQTAAVLDKDDSETGSHQNLTINTNLAANEITLADSLRRLAMALRAQGKWDEAKWAFLAAAESGLVSALDGAAWYLATCADPNVRDVETALNFVEKAVNATQRRTPTFLDTLAATYAAMGRFPEAASAQCKSIALEENPELKKEYQSRLRLFQSNLPYFEYQRMAAWLRKQGKPAEAERMYRDELTMRRSMFDKGHPDVADCLSDLAAVLHEQGKTGEAEPLARECLSIREEQLPDNWLTFDARRLLGVNLLAQKRYADAVPLLRSACEGLEQREATIPASAKSRLAESIRHLVQLYEATGRPEKAAEWNRKLGASDRAQ